VRFVRFLAAAAILGGTSLSSALAVADDDPGYVIIDGKRVATRIVPPRETQPDPAARQAQNEQTPSAPEPKSAPQRSPGLSRKYYADSPRWRVREYSVGGAATYRRPGYADDPHVILPHGYYGGADPWGIQSAVDQAYWAGRDDERYYTARLDSEVDTAQRTERLLAGHDRALDTAIEQLRAGDYSHAVAALTMAAKLDHGDPACRIHLAQARLALGHYDEAAKVLRRALQLQPKLAYVDLRLDKYYPPGTTMGSLGDVLATWAAANEHSAEVSFLQGYIEYQRGRLDAAYTAFEQASEGLPGDDLTRDYLSLTKPARVAGRK
jgi:tetratricopeptide (TPR) repeat protein